MAGIEGSGPIRLGSNSAQIPILLAKTKPQTFDRAQQEAMKSQSGVNPAASQAAAANLPASGSHNLQMHVSRTTEVSKWHLQCLSNMFLPSFPRLTDGFRLSLPA